MTNQVHLGDCLGIMQEFPSEYVDLIYLDPPFNTGLDFRDFSDKWNHRNFNMQLHFDTYPKLKHFMELPKQNSALLSYLVFLSARLIEMKRILRSSGSIYIHCDNNASSYLKVMMDIIYGEGNYRNEIVWKRSLNMNLSDKYARKFRNSKDVILFYVKEKSLSIFEKQYLSMDEEWLRNNFSLLDENGERYRLNPVIGGRHQVGHSFYSYKGYMPEYGWKFKESTIAEFDREGNLVWSKNGKPRLKSYMKDCKGKVVSDLWEDFTALASQTSERVDYSTQKPLALLKRIIQASSEEDDLILDPFCGSGTSLVAAKSLERSYIGIDINPKAIEISTMRLQGVK